MDLLEKINIIQTELKAPKNLFNSFGKYKYRNVEGIQEAVKPFLAKFKLVLILTDEVVEIGGRLFVKAIATIKDKTDMLQSISYAEIPVDKKGMDKAQITGASSSYARKYALNALLLLDDTKDNDTEEYQSEQLGKSEKIEKLKKKLSDEKIDEEYVSKKFNVKSIDELNLNQINVVFNNFGKLKESYKKDVNAKENSEVDVIEEFKNGTNESEENENE